MVRQTLKTLIDKIRGFISGPYRQKLPYLITVIMALIIVVVGVNFFVELSESVKEELMGNFDEQVTDTVLSFRNPNLTDYFVFVTEVGDVKGYLTVLTIIAILSILVFKRWKYVVQITFVLFLATVSNMMLKRVFDRARPEIEHLVSVKTLSYPSGHAMSAMAFYGFIIYLVYKFKINIYLKFLLIILLTILILSIGTSRIYLGVHFPSDVAGGFIAGMIWVFFCILVFNLVEVFRRDPKT